MTEKIGEITNYFKEVGVAVLHVTKSKVAIGDKIHIKGAHTDIEMEVKSMEIDREPVEEVEAGTKVGIKVPSRVRDSDEVFKVE